MLAAVAILGERLPVSPRIVLAPTVPRSLVEEHRQRAGVDVETVEGGRFDAIADSHLALCASGTATLEVGLLGTPMIVTYRLSSLSYLLARALVRLPHFSLVNLVAGREIVPELLQRRAAGGKLADLAEGLLRSPARLATMRGELAGLRSRLGSPGASGRAAEAVDRFLASRESAA